MATKKLIFLVFSINFIFFSSCAQKEEVIIEKETVIEQDSNELSFKEMHAYGGWYCPDNLGNFPPVDVMDLAKVPVVVGRLPTKEETRNGTSLMYFDTEKIPSAKVLEMSLPRLARYYSPHTKINELIIVIQAVVADQDTVVGFRYVNGGNGSSWYSEVDFLSDLEVAALKSTPFVSFDAEIKASSKKIWKALASTEYAQNLAKKFNQEAFFAADWTDNSRARLDLETENERATGSIMSMYGNLYLQIDYDRKGFHYAEKILVIENEDGLSSQIRVVAGPYGKDFETENEAWTKWLQEVKTKSEK